MNGQFEGSVLDVLALDVEGCAEFGMLEFKNALVKHGVRINSVNHWVRTPGEQPFVIIGTAANRRIQKIFEQKNVNCNLPSESLFLQWCSPGNGKSALVIAGTDPAGLMYNLLELARRVDKSGLAALSAVEDSTDSPLNRVRCVDRYLLGHLDNEWFHSEEFWCYFFQRLAKARFNRFCLILGFDTDYMAPPYPFFVRSEKYPDVTVKGFMQKDVEKNLFFLRFIGEQCHRYGMKFVLATWRQRPWARTENDLLIKNLPPDEQTLSEYCYNGIKELIRAVPEIDIVQFRINHESGVGTMVSAEEFWNRCVSAIGELCEETGRKIVLDYRAKGLTDEMIDYAFSRGLPVEVPTKYWCEHSGLPYHLSLMRTEDRDRIENTNFSRRYSYGNMLKRPQYYDLIFRLWNYGSTDLFLWGDADYGRRFSLSCAIPGSLGFQVDCPLSLKYGGELIQKETWKVFADPRMRHGEWEDERYWMRYLVFGRLGYNPAENPSVWLDEFERRFGSAGAVLERALALGSRIMPLITAFHMPAHPSMAYWPEMDTGRALFYENNANTSISDDRKADISYGNTEPSDHGLFYEIDEYARDAVAGRFTGKYSPLQAAAWLEYFAAETKRCLAAAAELIGAEKNSEYLAMESDLLMLCDLAEYHGDKTRAALALEFWNIEKQADDLSKASAFFDSAAEHWEALSARGGKNYYSNLIFGAGAARVRRGSWSDLSKELRADRAKLDELVARNGAEKGTGKARAYAPERSPAELETMSADFPETVRPGKEIRISVGKLPACGGEVLPVLHYRHMDQTEGVFRVAEMRPCLAGYETVIPGEYVTPEWNLQVYITVQGSSGVCLMLPGLYHPAYPWPYHIINVES